MKKKSETINAFKTLEIEYSENFERASAKFITLTITGASAQLNL